MRSKCWREAFSEIQHLIWQCSGRSGRRCPTSVRVARLAAAAQRQRRGAVRRKDFLTLGVNSFTTTRKRGYDVRLPLNFFKQKLLMDGWMVQNTRALSARTASPYAPAWGAVVTSLLRPATLAKTWTWSFSAASDFHDVFLLRLLSLW